MNLRPRRFSALLVSIAALAVLAQPRAAAGQPRSFLIVTHGLWGSMDNIPGDRNRLLSSPYPHYHKHQETAFLTGPDYRPIPQACLEFSSDPGPAKLFSRPYITMEREFSYWARVLNKRAGWEQVKILPDWQVLQGEQPPAVGEINLIYLKFDWRLGFPQIARDYAGPLLDLLATRWPRAEVHFVGHSLGGAAGRYVASRYPRRLASLVTVGAPHYGLHEVGRQSRGERTSYGGDVEKELAQAFGLWVVERVFFGSDIIQLNGDFVASAAEFTARYIPGAAWMDPQCGLLADGFGSMARLEEAVPQAIALYGLGNGSYDLQGDYHPEIYGGKGVGPGLDPAGGPPEYALSGDGRVDPVSARGPFSKVLCLGKEFSHGDLMSSPLVLTFLLDRYFFAGAMPRGDMRRALFRLGVEWRDEMEERIDWLIRAREVWEAGNRYSRCG